MQEEWPSKMRWTSWDGWSIKSLKTPGKFSSCSFNCAHPLTKAPRTNPKSWSQEQRNDKTDQWQALFGIGLVKTDVCEDCGKATNRPEPNKTTHLVNIQEEFKLQELLDASMSSLLEDCHCSGCNKRVDHSQEYVVKDPPEILLLQPNRWLSGKDFDKKNDEPIHFTGNEMIDLTSHLDKDRRKEFDSLKYRLCGVILHGGSTVSGHYMTLMRGEEDEWRLFNDTRVKAIEIGLWGKHEVRKGFTGSLYAFAKVAGGEIEVRPEIPEPATHSETPPPIDPISAPSSSPSCAASSDKSVSDSSDASTPSPSGTGNLQLGESSALDQLLTKQQGQINHLERGNRELRRCCQSQAVNLRKQEIILHSQLGARMKTRWDNNDARYRSCHDSQSGEARYVPGKTPKTMRRNGRLQHGLYVVKIAPLHSS
jgi:hypothetical protein